MLRWLAVHREVLDYYYAFRFDEKSDYNYHGYLSDTAYKRIINKANSQLVKSDYPQDYGILTIDKYICNHFMQSHGLPCVKVEALLYGDLVYLTDGSVIDIDTLFRKINGVYFIKPAIGSCGKSIIKIDVTDGQAFMGDSAISQKKIREHINDKPFFMQKKVNQHVLIGDIYSDAINCLRINTIIKGGIPIYLSAFMKIGTGNSVVDNWDFGSVLVGLNPQTGNLLKNGYYKPGSLKQGICHRHPDSNIRFDGYPIPFFHEAVEVCKKAHAYFYARFIIGWDIVITPEGPVILEANCPPEIHPQQVLYGGLKKELML